MLKKIYEKTVREDCQPSYANSEDRKLLDLAAELEEKLYRALGSEGQGILERLCDLQFELAEQGEVRAFSEGIKIGLELRQETGQGRAG